MRLRVAGTLAADFSRKCNVLRNMRKRVCGRLRVNGGLANRIPLFARGP